jgi:hypothetical protein
MHNDRRRKPAGGSIAMETGAAAMSVRNLIKRQRKSEWKSHNSRGASFSNAYG